MPKKTKAIMLKDLSDKFLVDPTKDIIIKLDESERNEKGYLKDTIKAQKESIMKLKEVINGLSGRQDELKYLREFKHMLSGHCIAHGVTKTCIQCTDSRRKQECKLLNQCEEMNKWKTLLIA